MKKVAVLVFLPDKRKNKLSKKNNDYFDFHANAGINVVIELLEDAGIDTDWCSAATAHRYEIVLVSLNSMYDVYALYKEVALRPDWQPSKRNFKVVCGGFGMLNPTTIRNYIDYAVFGRVEDFVVEMIEALLGGGDYDHPSVMVMPEIYKVKFAQASKLLDLECYKENAIGCRDNCKFCLYSWSRRYMGENVGYTRGGRSTPYDAFGKSTSKVSIEMLLKTIKTLEEKYPMVTSGLDGSSQRLRFLYGKKITSEDMIEAVEHLGKFEGSKFFKVFNIVKFPTETEEDREEYVEIFKKAKPKNQVVIKMHHNLFQPQPCTPMQYSPITLYPDESKTKLTTLFDNGKVVIKNELAETPYSHMRISVVSRATPETDKLFHTLCFSQNIRRAARDFRRLKLIENNFDLTPYLREYDVEEEKHPGWFLEGQHSPEALKKAYLWIKKHETRR
jgi:radical SAM superfamily enzyme YgiQ (UPF0313 family)